MTKPATTSIADALKEVTKRHTIPIGSMSTVVEDIEPLTTGNLAIDYLTGVGGLPIGRVTELYGQPSAGKTTTALQAAAALQQRIIAEDRDEYILYLDFEHAIDGDYAAALNLDVDHPSFILCQPNWLDDGADIGERLIKTGKIRLSIWDSVAEMTPKELEFGVRTNAMERARLMNSLLQRFNSLFCENHCAGVFLNHMVEAVQMGGRPGMPPQETSPGGKALKFYSSLRLAYKQIKNIKGKAIDALTGEVTEQVVATDVKVKVTKNKIGNPFREALVRVRFGHGFDNAWSALQVLTAHKQVVVGNAGFHYFDTKKCPDLVHPEMGVTGTGRANIQGEAAVLAFADAHPDWRDRLISDAIALIDTHGTGTALGLDIDSIPSLVGSSALDLDG